jgi:DNA-binding transcriptional regulator YdaS (Cro superfamily)
VTVYFIQAGASGPIKIGHTQSMSMRLDALQSGNPEVLRILAEAPGGQRQEYAIPRELAAHRMRAEWFHPTQEVLRMVERARSGDLPSYTSPTSSPEHMALLEAVRRAGSQAALARRINNWQGSISYRVRNGLRAPAHWCLPIERELGVPRHQLRPDLFRAPRLPAGSCSGAGA